VLLSLLMTESLELIDSIIPYIIKEQPSLQQAMTHSANVLSPHLSQSARRIVNEFNYKECETTLLVFTTGMITSEPPPSTIKAYCFGLFDMQGGMLKKYEYQRLYLSGSECFDPDDEDWACDPTWFPASRYYKTPLLNKIGKAQHATDPTAAYLLSLSFAAAVATNFGPLIASLTDDRTHPIPIAVGHDSGDLFVLGYATPEGIQRP